MNQLQAEITQDDIDQGVRGSIGRCAIALVAKRILGHNDVSAGIWTVMDHRDGAIYEYSKELRDWVARFDTDKSLVYPGTFVLTEVREDPEKL